MTKGYHVPESRCTACGHFLDRAGGVDNNDRKPKPGDVSICIECGHIMVFGDDMQLRDPTGEEMYEIAGDKDVLAAQRALAELKKYERENE